MAAVAYNGRTIDLWLFQKQEKPSGPLPQSLFIPVPGYICTGIEKLIQRWLIEFNTELGSFEFLPTRGCTFLREFKRGRLRSEIDILAEFGFSADQIFNTIVGSTSDTAPSDEQLAAAELTEISILADQLQLSIAITSVAGTSRQVILPIQFSVISTG
jgi:hypothetical protein